MGGAWRWSAPSLASINRWHDDYADFADFADRSFWQSALLVAARGRIRVIREICVIEVQLLGFIGREFLTH